MPKAKGSMRFSDVSVALGNEGQEIIEGILRVVMDEACSAAALAWATRRLARSSLNRLEAEQRLLEVATACGWTHLQAYGVIDKSWPQKLQQTKMKL